MGKKKLLLILLGTGISVVVVAVLLATVGKTAGQVFFGRSFAEDQLKEYIQRVLNQEANGLSCQAVDTDNNGYVSCDFTTKVRPDATMSVECAAWGLDGFLNRGCRKRPIIPSQ